MGANSKSEDITLSSLDRARVYRALAQLFRVPERDWMEEARERDLPELCQALERQGADKAPDLIKDAGMLCDLFADADWERLSRGHYAAFDESSGIRSAPTEMDQLGGPPQLELTRTFEMADVAGFYKAFGVQVGEGDERVDHIATELEFMNLLAVKEYVALCDDGEGENAEICHDASRVFLRDHLLRWAPRLGGCLAEADLDPIYRCAGRLLSAYIAFDAEQIDAARAPVHVIDPTKQEAAAESL